jgi:hypothetical protein
MTVKICRAPFALLAVCLIAVPVNGARCAEGDRMVYGAGMITCAEWQQYRSTGNKVANAQLEAWIDGFLSGYNTASDDTDFIIPKPETIAYYAWIDNYCSQNPLNKVMQATMALKNELAARARR